MLTPAPSKDLAQGDTSSGPEIVHQRAIRICGAIRNGRRGTVGEQC